MNGDAPLPPAFGPLERRLDPALAAEDANPLFEAFRARRRLHGAPGFAGLLSLRTLRLRVAALSPLAWVAFAAILVGANVAGGIWGRRSLYFVMILAWVAAMFMRATSRSSAEHGTVRLPARLAAILLAQGGRGTRGETDLWMTGAGGSTLAQALYLEIRERSLATTAIIAELVALFAIAAYWKTAPDFRPSGILLSASVLWFAWKVAQLIFAAGAAGTWTRVEAIAQRWHALAVPLTLPVAIDRISDTISAFAAAVRDSHARRTILLAAVRIVGKPVLLLAAVVAVLAGIVYLAENSPTLGGAPLAALFDAINAVRNAAGWELLVAVLVLLSAIATGKAAAKDDTQAAKARERAMRNFERSYNLYMAKVIHGDPDALAWADMVWPEDRSGRLAERLRAIIGGAGAARSA